MARPRRSTEQEWLDIFCDWDVEEQSRTLAFLQELHRQAKRQAAKRNGTQSESAELFPERTPGAATILREQE